MKTVWKLTINPWAKSEEKLAVDLPGGAIVRHVAMQSDVVAVWVEVDTDALKIPRTFELFGTGHEVPAKSIYQGTVLPIPGLVFHLYETF